jgi:hypothetical protein
VLVASVAIRTNPARKVPTMAPTVPSADTRPTTVPVSSSDRSRSFTTIGGTADRSAAGVNTAMAATNNTMPASCGARAHRST